MAKRRPSQSRAPTPTPTPPVSTGEDNLTAAVLRLLAWAQTRTQTLIVLAAVFVVLVLGTIYWFQSRSAQLDAAAGELEEIQQSIAFDDLPTVEASIQGFLDRHGGTSYEVEARLLLARAHLLGGSDPTPAIDVLEAVAPDLGTPLQVDATFVLAAAFEQAGRWGEASDVYQEIIAGVDLEFQEIDAMEGLARSWLASGDTASAVEAYRDVLNLIDADDPERARFEMRVAELTARGD